MLSILAFLSLTLSAVAAPATVTVPQTEVQVPGSDEDCQPTAAHKCYKICDWGWLYHPCNFDPSCDYYRPKKDDDLAYDEGEEDEDELDERDDYDWDVKGRLSNKQCVTICSVDPDVRIEHDCSEKVSCK